MALRVGVVGISYDAHPWRLPAARTDALALLQAFRGRGEQDGGIFVAVEAEQTAARPLRAGLQRFFAESGPGDDVVLAFEGHAERRGDQTYLWASDHEPGRRGTAIRLQDIIKWMRAGGPRNRILLVDACHAGQSRPTTGPGSDLLSPGAGVSVLAACDLDEESLEVDELGGGVFTSVVRRGLAGAAGRFDGTTRVVTVTDLFRYVAREVPGWVRANAVRFGLPPTARMTPRMVCDLTGDPVLVAFPRAAAALPRPDDHLPATLPTGWGLDLTRLEDVARTAARRATGLWPRVRLHLNYDDHQRELRELIGRCLRDCDDPASPDERYILAAAARVHDLGLLRGGDPGSRFTRAARFVRDERADDLPVRLPTPGVAAAVAAVLERAADTTGGPPPAGGPIRIGLLARILGTAHRLAVFGERWADDAGGGEVGGAWVRRPLVAAIDDWAGGSGATVRLAPRLSPLDRAAVRAWHARVGGELPVGAGDDRPIGPLWLDIGGDDR